MEDLEIIELYNKRSEDAILKTQEKYGSYLGRITYGILGNREDCEECISDSLLKSWNSIPPAKPDNLKLFVAKIARNTAIDRYLAKTAEKRGGSQTDLCLDELSECIADESSAFDSEYVSKLISAYLRTKDSKDAKIFVRRYWYMDSVKDVATYCNCSDSKVKTTLFRMRAELKAYLSKEGIEI